VLTGPHRVRFARVRPADRPLERYRVPDYPAITPRPCRWGTCGLVEWYDTLAGRVHHDYYAMHRFLAERLPGKV
jgi:hypothetical protein